jgi:SAM-dependent methyltransferase
MNATLKKVPRKIGQVKLRTRWLLNEIIDRLSPAPIQLQCPICEFTDSLSHFKTYSSRCIFRGGKLVRHQCPNCGVIFGTQRMLALSSEQLSQEYVEHYSCYDEGDSTESELRAFQYLQPTMEGMYLNFGCGKWSETVSKLRSQGYNIFGFEPYASETSNCEYIIKSFAELKKFKFDGIMSNDVLEHLRYPEQTLSSLASLLKEGGFMVHATPCYQYSHEYTRFHLFFFTGNSLDMICQKANITYQNTDRVDTKIFRKCQ